MIQEFEIRNFYSIRERQVLSFVPSAESRIMEEYTYEVKPGVRLLKMAIIYGANASGKTTVLKALDYFRDILTLRPASKVEDMGYHPFLLDSHSRDEHSEMKLTFYLDGERYVLSCEFDQKRIYHESLVVYLTNRPNLVYRREYSEDSEKATVTFGAQAGLSRKSQHAVEGNTTNNCTVMAAVGQTNIEISRLNKVFGFISVGIQDMLQPKMDMLAFVKDELRYHTEDRLKPFLLQVLKASDFNIADFTLYEDEKTITPELANIIQNAPLPEEARQEMLKKGTIRIDDLVFQHTGDGGIFELHESNESAGTRRFMGMAAMLYELVTLNQAISIDEVETSIHYDLLSYFIKLFLANSQGSSQLLMTTHDINLLDEDFIRRDVVWFTDKENYGATSLHRLSSLGLHKTLSAYNAYRQGKLSKLPFLGSIYLETPDA